MDNQFKVDESSLREHHRICSNHFSNGDQIQTPSLALGRRFLSPRKYYTERGKQALKRRALFVVPPSKRQPKPRYPEKDTLSESDDGGSRSDTPMSAQAGEQLMDTSYYSIYKLPDELDSDGSSVATTSEKGDQDETEVIVSNVLLS